MEKGLLHSHKFFISTGAQWISCHAAPVEGDPLANIDDVTRVQCVMKNGKIRSVGEIMKPFMASSIGADVCP
jgi:hypothetical protein